MNAVKQWNNVMCFGCFCDLYHKNSTVWNTNHILLLHRRQIYAISLMIGPAMRSGRCTWRPSCRTTEKLWHLRTLPRRSSPPLPVIPWVEQVRNKLHPDHVFSLFESLHHSIWAFPLPSSGHPMFSNPFSTSSTSVTLIYLHLTPYCLHLLMNIKWGWYGCRLTDFKHVAASTSSESPSWCCVCLLLFQTASFCALTFPCEYKKAF